MKKTVVTFVVNKEIDIANHLIGLDSYKKKLHSGVQQRNEKFEKLLKLSAAQRKKTISTEIDWYYAKKRKFLDSLTKDINVAWEKIEKDFIRRIEKIHKAPFTFKHIDGVLSSAQRFGYHSGEWFATSMFQNKFKAMDTAMHEMMHFMFYKYYWKTCIKRGLSDQQAWDVKESFTMLLNLEFIDLRFDSDRGYPEHKEIREVIKQSWRENHDFDKTLNTAINLVKR